MFDMQGLKVGHRSRLNVVKGDHIDVEKSQDGETMKSHLVFFNEFLYIPSKLYV
jgi:hypothetical protein